MVRQLLAAKYTSQNINMMKESHENVTYQFSEFGLNVLKDDVWRKVLLLIDGE